MNSLKELQKFGQSFWLDYIRRSLITGGELERLVKEDGLRGVTSNLTIFQKAIAGSTDYDESLENLIGAEPHTDVPSLYEKLAVEDIQMAADVMRKVYQESDGSDGFVCMELSPELAHDTKGSIREARHLWKEVNRPNFMIKVPATQEGIQVIETLTAEGINVNVTLIFSLSHYEAVAHAYLNGLERCSDPQKTASVASLFVSRVDKAVDKALEDIGSSEALHLKGKTAIANAKTVYKSFQDIFSGERWERLKKRGARVQRPLWGSTKTKNPLYSDVLYVEELIGPHTVNTMPPVTLNAFRNHGRVRSSLQKGIKEAEKTLHQLASLGIDLDAMTEKLQAHGVDSSAKSYNSLLDTLKNKRREAIHGLKDHQVLSLGKFQKDVDDRLKNWKKKNYSRRLWAKDPRLWFPEPGPEVTDRLGWLELPEIMHERLDDLNSFASEVKKEGISHVVLVGMGGSSLAPDIFRKNFGSAPGFPRLIVLDSTHPQAVRSVEDKLDFTQTLFLVSSKSGTTLETLSLFRYFWKKVKGKTEKPGHHFAAVTDPGSPLMKTGRKRGFRRVFQAKPDVGGRYSAFTYFGLVPAALMGMDTHRLLDKAWIASENNSFCVSEEKASGLTLGAALGELAQSRDKLTFLVSSSLLSFPDWIEQLIAESTGKNGRGLIPVVNEPWVLPDQYSKDRFFVFLFFEGDENKDLEKLQISLAKAGHPFLRHNLTERFDIGREIFWWEIGVASAGSVMGIHPFNQPDVQLAKDFTKKAMEKKEGTVSQEEKEVETLSVDETEVLAKALNSWINQAQPGDYIGIQSYLAPDSQTTAALQNLRLKILKRTRSATTLGYGPRFLHSTGQLHKGGPDKGLFLQLIDEPERDLSIPETKYSFGRLIQAQALGDYMALRQRKRRVLRVNLKTDAVRGIEILGSLIKNYG